MVALSDENTTQWDVMEWLSDQGKYLPGASHFAVLAFLCIRAFYTDDNPEGGQVGQVMRAASFVDRIRAGTGIRSRETVRKVLNDLQDMAYIQRQEREETGFGHSPHLIFVLWNEDRLRQEMREGKKTLPNPLKVRPSAAPRRDRHLASVTEIPLSINS